jgi:hypothetical protein
MLLVCVLDDLPPIDVFGGHAVRHRVRGSRGAPCSIAADNAWSAVTISSFELRRLVPRETVFDEMAIMLAIQGVDRSSFNVISEPTELAETAQSSPAGISSDTVPKNSLQESQASLWNPAHGAIMYEYCTSAVRTRTRTRTVQCVASHSRSHTVIICGQNVPTSVCWTTDMATI